MGGDFNSSMTIRELLAEIEDGVVMANCPGPVFEGGEEAKVFQQISAHWSRSPTSQFFVFVST